MVSNLTQRLSAQKNDRLTLAAEKELKKAHHGMRSNVEIDYRNPSQVYLDTVAGNRNTTTNNNDNEEDVVFVANKDINMIREQMIMKNAGTPIKSIANYFLLCLFSCCFPCLLFSEDVLLALSSSFYTPEHFIMG